MNMGGNSYYLGSTLGALLYIIIKLLIVVLAVVVVLGVVVWVRDNLFQNDSSKIVRDIKSDPLLKAVSVITLAIVGIVLLFAIINGVLNFRTSSNMGYNPSYGIAGVLFLLIRVLMFILVISLVLAGLTYLKDLYENDKLNIFASANKSNNNESIIGTDTQESTNINTNENEQTI